MLVLYCTDVGGRFVSVTSVRTGCNGLGPFFTLPFTAHVYSTYCAGNLYSYATGGLTVVANLHNQLT